MCISIEPLPPPPGAEAKRRKPGDVMTSVPMGRPLSRNLVVNVVGPLLPMVVSFVTVPLYIHAIGAARYGVVTLTWILLGYLGVLDFGLSRAAANALGKLAHASSRERSSVLITTLYLNLLFGSTASALFYAIGGALLWRWFPLSGELAHEAVAAFPWMVPMLPLGLLGGVAIGALDSRERFLLATTLNSCGVVLGLVLPLVSVMIFGPSLTVIIPAVMLVRLGVVLAMLTAVFWVERPIHSFAPDFVWARKLFGYGAWVSVSSVISPILDTFDQMIIGRMLGAAAVAPYGGPMNLAIRGQVLAQALAWSSCTRNSRSRCGRFASSSSTDGTTTVRQAPGSPANFAAKTRRSPTASSRSVLARRAPRVTKMLVGDNVVDHAVGGQKSMQPKSIPPGLKAADDTHRRVIRRIQPVAQAGDESKQSCAVARFQTMKHSLGSLVLEA